MSTDKKSKRETIIRKVKALLSKTVENGTTEEEAMAAAAKAAELMAAYDLEMDEVDTKEAGIAKEKYPLHPTFGKHMRHVAQAISILCGVRTWKHGEIGKDDVQIFYGLPHDVEVAGYLARICERAMALEVGKASVEWLLLPRKYGILSDSFLTGMSERLHDRIEELSWVRTRATGSALVPVKDALIEQAMKDEGIKLKDCRLGIRDLNPKAWLAGLKAGDKVALNAAVGKDGKPLGVIEVQGEDVQ